MSAFAFTTSEDDLVETEPPTATPGKTRSSCDRCHSQKLRCVKRSGRASCDRCLRLRCRCRYSPRAPRVSRSSRQPPKASVPNDTEHKRLSITAPTNLAARTAAATWSGAGVVETINDSWQSPLLAVPGGLVDQTNVLAFEPLDTHDPIQQAAFVDALDTDNAWGLQQPRDAQPPLNTWISTDTNLSHVSDQGRYHGPSFAVQRLATLQVDVCGCLASFPSVDNARDGAITVNTTSSRPETQFSFDELFRLTTDFVEIMEAVNAARLGPGSTLERLLSATKNLHNNHEFDLLCPAPGNCPTDPPIRDENSLAASLQHSSHVDEATMWMIASCHCTLTQLYSAVFRRMQTCLEHSRGPRPGHRWNIVLPQVHVGSLVLPPLQVGYKSPATSKATSSMYMVMITALSTQLWEKVGGALPGSNEVTECSSYSSSSSSSLSGMVWRTMKDGTDNLMREITYIQRLLH
ncbi:Zn(2)-C6 fungal-type DNA-binding domain protein [Niveomyces insectorum RCEF 264]|uniref:Zn(2)-C6 fungal-type DNA-binding domain protein n=1 Tax=Niveomyces insectorum RCEF 264 TaxID=1081102 RepID=A0A162LC46_9HYPO|nr:Zn(2)-C6 fungal-type DNA-binding domain protein [Niveomyces insectorum RCEF 264]